MKRIVILGAGFGGLYTANDLCRYKDKFEIVLINKEDYFTFTPLIHEVATAGIRRRNVIYPLDSLICNDRLKFIKAVVKSIDLKNKKVLTSKGNFKYDLLVIALGSKTNFYNLDKNLCYELKTIKDAKKLRKEVFNIFETASKEKNINEIKKLLTIVLIGAGPTGIELASELKEYGIELIRLGFKNLNKENFKVILLQRSDRILSMLPEDCIDKVLKRFKKLNIDLRFNSKVDKLTKDGIYVNNNFIPAKIKICTTGVEPNFINLIPNIFDKGIKVNSKLQVNNYENVFCIGDMAIHINPEGKRTPMLAQAAVQQANIVAKNIFNLINNNELIDFQFKKLGFLLSLGQKFAVAEVLNKHFKGFFAWWLWRTIYLSKVVGLKNKLMLAYDWTIGLFRKRYIKNSFNTSK